VLVTADPALIRSAERVVVPGQAAAAGLHAQPGGKRGALSVARTLRDKPYLACAFGLQMLFEHGAEGDTRGLGRAAG